MAPARTGSSAIPESLTSCLTSRAEVLIHTPALRQLPIRDRGWVSSTTRWIGSG
jgi:hypothetical protein